jgi:hypothetical protein
MDGHWQTEGDISGMPGYRFRGRRLVRNLQLMHFPRFIRRGARDYFYLMLRPLLPGAPLAGFAAEPGEGAWTVAGLPQRGWPHALATTTVRPDSSRPETKVRVLSLDPTVLRPASDADPTKVVLSLEPSEGTGTAHLDIGTGVASIGTEPPKAGTVRVASGDDGKSGTTSAAVCVDQWDKIVYAEVATAPDPARDAQVLGLVLDAAHCKARFFLRTPLRIALGGIRDLSDHPSHPTQSAVRLIRSPVPGARRVFPETPILPPQTWQPLQRQTRWFPKDPEPATSGNTVMAAPSVER